MNLPVRVSLREWEKRDAMFEKGFHWCSKHKEFLGLLNFPKNKTSKYGYNTWCRQCQSLHRSKNSRHKEKSRRRQFTSHYKQLAGGECVKCGYSKSQGALEFHHVNREEKEVKLSLLINQGSPHEIICLELDKCIMLCRNCHTEFEGGVWSCEFEKVKLGYKIKDDSIIEYQENCWYEVSDKILYGQASLLG